MPERVAMSRRQPWRIHYPDAIIIARPSRWGNPYPVDEYGRDLALALFRNTASGMWNPSTLGQDKSDEVFDVTYERHTAWSKRLGGHPLELAPIELAGHDLACWCGVGIRCHGDFLLTIANPRSHSSSIGESNER